MHLAPTWNRAAGLAVFLAFHPVPLAADVAGSGDCGPVGGLQFVCGAKQPEDLADIPGTPWVAVSGYSPGSGLKLLQTRLRTLRRWTGSASRQWDFDRSSFPRCPGPPDGTRLNLQGLSLRADGTNTFRLLAANHGGRESIEVFRVHVSPGDTDREPLVQWIGCLPLPSGMAANAVSSFPDGTVLATVLTVPGRTMADYVLGRNTGVVLEWAPRAQGFRAVSGTELPGNNGLEADPDNRHFYVVAFGRHSVVTFLRGRRARRLSEAVAPGFMPDNIHWDGLRLMAAGMAYDEPACGGPRGVVNGVADAMTCHRGYTVALLDPVAGRWQIVAHDIPNPIFNGVSTGLRIGATLWLGSYQSDRIASRPLQRLSAW